ncbi:2,3,4,5-tetrahydropyridine-2,6-dicarboxylate N-acetyltransferase [Novipirellula galeiformis]|uniref:2,3,4,5-tetrahydropyridine-2,6-dicarboxylate N-acetyltransferase n=1 Tax=Novipirellula galeiformis TaxID=2528004 RepID=A0A5C6CMP1_9BACT|nr:gamma carbonic anhydrase family protein [Novipirellula galeiformis]TWU24059.1 2,3,4,5-tetrahydropyridine-2,6-dicarboxylate N-acetyltransferase [Novipirellula galeiformis]
MSERQIDPVFRPEKIDPSAFVADNVTICGDVTIGESSSVWFGSVVRGDTEFVRIGKRTNIQDLSLLHTDHDAPCQIGDDVTVGHSAVVHGATVEDGALIGIRAVVLSRAKIGAGAIVAAGAVVTEGAVIPPGKLAVGVPAKVIADVTPEQRQRLIETAQHYVDSAAVYKAAKTEA